MENIILIILYNISQRISHIIVIIIDYYYYYWM